MQSEQINEIAKALADIQGELKDPKKEATAEIQMKGGGKYTFSYAPLPTLLRAIRPVIGPPGLSVSSEMIARDGMLMMISTLLHTSGQFRTTEYPVSPIAADHKTIGSGITYALRRNNQILLNISAEEDRDTAGTEAPAIMSSAEAKRRGIWEAFEEDMKDISSLTALERLIRYYEKEIYPTLKNSWRAQIDGEFDAKLESLSKPMNKPVEDMSNAELDELALEHDERDPATLSPLEAE